MLLITKSFKRQKYINLLNRFIDDCVKEFDRNSIDILKEQIQYLNEQECDELFSEEFWIYDFLKFGKTRLEIDDYHPQDCRTFQKFNDSLRIALMIINYEENL
jgi:hypothetical protein